MKKLIIVLTTCMLLPISLCAQQFVIPTPKPLKKITSNPSTTKGNTSGNTSTKILPPKTPRINQTVCPVPDITTGQKVEGIERSIAISELEESAQRGDINAHTQLGMYYYSKDDDRALNHLRIASEANNYLAQYYLAGIYYHGKFGIPTDKATAASLFLKSANQNHAPAQFSLAICYYNGEGIEQDRKAALEWMEKAALNNYEDAKAFIKENSFE